MKILALFFLLIGCQDYNSDSFDKDNYGPSELTGGADFRTAYPIIKDRCASCHAHSDWSGYKSEQDWVTQGLVKAGDSANSSLVYRIVNYGGDMPEGQGAIPDDEFNAIKTWVDNLQ